MSEIIYFLVSFIISLILGFFWIRIAKRKGVVEYCLLKMNKGKQGTPTIGGVIMIIPLLLFLLINFSYTYLILVIFGLIFFLGGFVDDIRKIKHKRNLGLSKINKLMLHFLFGVGFCLLFYFTASRSVPYLIFNSLYFVFFVNAVNITDGLDGLAIGNYIIALLFFLVAFKVFGNTELFLFSLVLLGACLSFLVFNINPAKLFMGDAGASMLGSLIAMIAILGKLKYFLFIVGFIFVAEGLSSFLQMFWKRVFHRKLFLIAPVHHIFQMKKVSERRIVFGSWIVSLFFCLIGLVLLF